MPNGRRPPNLEQNSRIQVIESKQGERGVHVFEHSGIRQSTSESHRAAPKEMVWCRVAVHHPHPRTVMYWTGAKYESCSVPEHGNLGRLGRDADGAGRAAGGKGIDDRGPASYGPDCRFCLNRGRPSRAILSSVCDGMRISRPMRVTLSVPVRTCPHSVHLLTPMNSAALSSDTAFGRGPGWG